MTTPTTTTLTEPELDAARAQTLRDAADHLLDLSRKYVRQAARFMKEADALESR